MLFASVWMGGCGVCVCGGCGVVGRVGVAGGGGGGCWWVCVMAWCNGKV